MAGSRRNITRPRGRRWEEVVAGFGGESGSPRVRVLSGLLAWRDALRAKGMAGLVILNGSFISGKPEPGDFDLIFVYDEDTRLLIDTDEEAKTLTSYA